ncbi:MAG TPA: glycosyltransferase [Gaiellaceae bacterium]|nr:glycosyltransferase [Gaiellaceae bacterium]
MNDLHVCVVHLDHDNPSETFARAHVERLPCRVSVVHGTADRPLYLDDQPLEPGSRAGVVARLGRRVLLRGLGRDMLAVRFAPEYLEALRLSHADVLLAEFGPVGVQAMDACHTLGVPLVVHFHGYDVSSRDVLAVFGESYRRLFGEAAAVVAPSTDLSRRLLELGAPPERLHHSANGVDCARFTAGDPASAPPTFVAVGRLVEKKRPDLTITAFAQMAAGRHGPHLRIVGEGPLRDSCEALASRLCPGAVDFLGEQPHDVVARELRGARAFVQHSAVAANGDVEGMPVAVLEAGASGLAAVATRHGGIGEVVVDGETGFLVEEHDVDAMAARMATLADDPVLAGRLGRAARSRIETFFSLDASIERLWRIVQAAAHGRREAR